MDYSLGLGAVVALALVGAGACGESVEGGGGNGGDGAATTTSSTVGSGGSGGAGGSGPGAGGGDVITCDDLGFCGEPMDPGCVACAISEGSCQDEYQACKDAPDNSCLDLLDCYRDCSDGDQPCFDGCDTQFQLGVLPLSLLFDCVFCDECPVSCNIDTSSC